ncbi:sulfatase-like hydrolase/transferase [Myxococcota bacterium]|nr:sulfatase-like hydrolase/transferase [Myxococcota bacterium]
MSADPNPSPEAHLNDTPAAEGPTAPGDARVDRAALGLAGAALLGWALFGLANVLGNALLARAPASPLAAGTRALVGAYDLGHALAAGLCIALPLALWARFVRGRTRLGWVLLFVLAPVAAYPLISEDVIGPANRFGKLAPAWLWMIAFVTALTWGVLVGAAVARRVARRFWRVPVALGGLAFAALNHFVLPRDYPGAHLLIMVAGATAAGMALVGLRLPLGRRAGLAALVLAVAGAGASLAVPPPNAVQARLLDIEAAALTAFVWRSADDADTSKAKIPDTEWFKPRHQAKPVPASTPALVPTDAVIIFYGVDSLRQDALTPAYRQYMPQIMKFRDEAISFDTTRAPGSQTIYTLTQIFTGTYFSQQYWSSAVTEGYTALWPHEEKATRFTEVLAKAGVPTVHYGQAEWFLNRYGMTSGFTEERWVEPPAGKRWSEMPAVTDAMIARLRAHQGGPLFMFVHNLDAHAPYERVPKKGTARQQYQVALGLVDEQFGRLRQALVETGLETRAVIILTADHGEGFGEHGTSYHGQNLYDEQVRVPLMIRLPDLAPRKITTPISLMDIGPTLLDLMGQETPAHMMGQSLVPFLRGEKPKLTRPIIAEGRLKQSMVTPDNFKVLFDQRSGTKEIYDLTKDPKELKNLYDELGPEGEARIATLRAFFEVHKIRRKGYKIPYRR